MSVARFFIHVVVILSLQLLIINNLQMIPYTMVSLFPLIIYILPSGIKFTFLPIIGFILGLLVDISTNTIGVHAAATTMIAWMRPRMLVITSGQQMNIYKDVQKLDDSFWFFRYISFSTLIFNFALLIIEVFSFNDFHYTLLRILLSTVADITIIELYYFLFIKTVKNSIS